MRNKTIGIIGGGQLGRMLAMAASRLGFQVIVLDPQENCPAAQLCSHQIVAAYDDAKALACLAEAAHIITYEFENVPVTTAQFLEMRAKVFPPARALEISQDRLVEKQFFAACGIATAPYWSIDKAEDLYAALEESGGRGILKTRRLGYDGKGQVRLDSAEQVANALAAINHAPAILEGFVDFTQEISVLAARSTTGMVKFFDIPENVHIGGILRRSSVPAAIDAPIVDLAQDYALKLLEALDYVGVIALELFVDRAGRLVANEFAPRVHNSGHWTEAACCVSQFDLHIRAIADLPLIDPIRHSPCVMENLIGNDVEKLPQLLAQTNIMLHLYGKHEVREGRKMGHFTRLMPLTTSSKL